MPCFCKAPPAPLNLMMPKASLSVMAVPPQMMNLLSLLGLQGLTGESRADLRLAAMLPNMTPDMWLQANFNAHAPTIQLPAILPSGGGIMMSMMMKLAMVAPHYPVLDPRALMAQVQQAALSLAAHVLPQAQAIPAIPMPQLQNMALAARLTLALRAQGICPMALANLDYSFAAQAGAADSRGTCSAALNFAATLPRLKLPPFALPLPKVDLARSLALMAPAAEAPAALGLPAITDPNLTKMLMSQLAMLSTVPVPNLPISLDELQAMADKLNDLAVINEAFGDDAMTPAGVARINAMLQFMATLKIPLPLDMQALKLQLDALPKIEDVTQGAQAASTGAINMAASMSLQPPPIPIMPLLEALTDLASKLPTGALGPCSACDFEIGPIADSLSQMQLPSPPALPALPF